MSKNDNTIKEKIAELDALLAWFDSEEVDIEAALEQFEKVEKLAAEIKAELQETENKIEVIKQKFDR
jgi:exodeoxyribonuclease VII small subunit